MDQIKSITEERHLTCIVNLHQVNYAKKYASRIIGIKDGRIVFDGVPADLTDDIIADIYKGKEEQTELRGEAKNIGRVPAYA
jgi:phosphonate transport system ATP-binding protein